MIALFFTKLKFYTSLPEPDPGDSSAGVLSPATPV